MFKGLEFGVRSIIGLNRKPFLILKPYAKLLEPEPRQAPDAKPSDHAASSKPCKPKKGALMTRTDTLWNGIKLLFPQAPSLHYSTITTLRASVSTAIAETQRLSLTHCRIDHTIPR